MLPISAIAEVLPSIGGLESGSPIEGPQRSWRCCPLPTLCYPQIGMRPTMELLIQIQCFNEVESLQRILGALRCTVLTIGPIERLEQAL